MATFTPTPEPIAVLEELEYYGTPHLLNWYNGQRALRRVRRKLLRSLLG